MAIQPDWDYPETWKVGDNLNAETLNRRVRDPMSVLLRRPLFVAHQAGAAQQATTGTNFKITFDTIDVDDDDMAQGVTPVQNIYAQREGTYQFWLNVTFGGTAALMPSLQCCIWIQNASATRRWDYQAMGNTVTAAGQYFTRSITGTIFLNVGEYFVANCFQNSGGNTPIQVGSNTPRIAVMWMGIT